MKALTICQPFAHLICLPDDDDRRKRVENRTWPTSYRGPLLIHAGKSRQWLELNDAGDRDELYDLALADMTFGAIVGIADLRDCVQLGSLYMAVGSFSINGQEVSGGMSEQNRKIVPDSAKRRWPWLEMHEHTEGPFCWVLQEVRKFATPIPYKGAQGIFNVPREVVAEAMEAKC